MKANTFVFCFIASTVFIFFFQNCAPNSQTTFTEVPSISGPSNFSDMNQNGIDDTLEVAQPLVESPANILKKNSAYVVCELSTNKEDLRFSDLVEFGGTVDLPGNRFLEYDIVDKSQTDPNSIISSSARKRIQETLRAYLKRNFERAGLKNSDFVSMNPGDIYNEQTRMFQPVSEENMQILRTALTLPETESGFPNLLPLPAHFFHYEVEGGKEIALHPQQLLENFVGNLRFAHLTSVMPGLIGYVLQYIHFLDVPKSIAMGAKNQNLSLDTTKTLEVPSHKICYRPQYDGSILERTVGSTVTGDSVRLWDPNTKVGSAYSGARVQQCFHDENKKCVSDNWLHRTNGFSERLYNIEIQ